MTPLQKELQETLKALLENSDQGSLEVATQYGWVLGKGSLPLGKSLNRTGLCNPMCTAVNPEAYRGLPTMPLGVYTEESLRRHLQVLIQFPPRRCRGTPEC